VGSQWKRPLENSQRKRSNKLGQTELNMKDAGMIRTRGLLEKAPVLLGALLFSSYESTISWMRIERYARFPHDLVTVFALAFVTFGTVSISYRSSFLPDRMVFGAFATTFLLMSIRMASLTSTEMFIVKLAEALMWTVAAFLSMAVLLRYRFTRARNNK